ncbi:MAG: AAA family ATPase, partial [Hamadaea sp.]|nr:AAA family ATPase [Hamadaea sp.]
MVRVNVLGPLRVHVVDQQVDAGAPRQRAVLARLVCAAGEVVPADRLLDDLWEGEPPPKALGTLQVYVSNLRRVLEPDRTARTPATVLVSTAPGYALRLARADVDAWRFEDLVTALAEADADPIRLEALADEALGLWAGPAYAEVADEAWAQPEVARLAELRAIAVELRADAVLRQGQAARIVPDLDRHVRAHPLREEAVRLLTLALYRSGRQADALAVLRRARDHLADELGVDPGPALRAMESDILRQAAHLDQPAPRPEQHAVPASRPTDPAAGGTQSYQLVGRRAERERLAAAAARAHAEGCQIVWISGEPGAGKTALAEACAADLGWPVAWGRCPEVDGAPPAWPWSEVLGTLTAIRRPEAELAAPLARLLHRDATVDADAGGQFWLARAVGDYLTAAAGDGPLMIILDDVHRADEETLQILRQVAGQLRDAPVLLLAAYRSDEAPDVLGATWAALAGARSETVELTGLAAQDAADLLRRDSGVDLGDEAAAALAVRTGGNPLFLRETARLIAAEGADAATAAVPAGVRNVLRRRIGRLPAKAQTVLRHAAVLGRDADVDLLLEVAGAEEDVVLDALEAAVLTGLLTEPAPGRVRFAHALVLDTLYQDTPLLRRTRLHAKVLATLERTRPADVAALARHALARSE